jgi:hypothetical protein
MSRLRTGKRSGSVLLSGMVALAFSACLPPDPTPVLEESASTLPPPTATPGPEIVSTYTAEPLSPNTTPMLVTATPSPIDLDGAPLANNNPYVLPLTIQHVTETSATLLFELTAPAEGILLYGPVEGSVGDQSWLPLSTLNARQQVVLDGLAPGVEYRAAVGLAAGGGEYLQPPFVEQPWGSVRFRTASRREPLRFGVVGDSGFAQQVTFDLAQEMAAYDLDFVLHTGDLVYHADENANPPSAFALKWFLPFAPLLRSMPVYPVVGNHDLDAATYWEDAPYYYYAFPPFSDPLFGPSTFEGRSQWYAFAYGNIQFLMLDTQTFFGEAGRSEQDLWLIDRLSDGRFAYTIPVLHVPPYSSGLHGDTDSLPPRLVWSQMFETTNVPLAFSGHDHDYERLLANGITYIVSGGGSATLYELESQLPESQFFAQRTHFVLAEVYGDRIELSAIGLEGEVFDRAVIPLE